jgi:chromosome segregation ATPase
MNISLTGLNSSIAGFQKRIKEEEDRLAVDTQVKREELNRKLEVARDAVAKADQANKDLLEAKRQKIAEQESVKQRGLAAEARKNGAQERIAAAQSMITQCKEKGQNALAPYGRDIKAVLGQIAQMRWHGEPPIGPLGMCVKLKDAVWADLMRIQLGSLMSAFAVTDARDRPQLKKLLDHYKKCVGLLFCFSLWADHVPVVTTSISSYPSVTCSTTAQASHQLTFPLCFGSWR